MIQNSVLFVGGREREAGRADSKPVSKIGQLDPSLRLPSPCWVCLFVSQVLLSGLALEREEKRAVSARRENKAGGGKEVGRNRTAGNDKRSKTLSLKPKPKGGGRGPKRGEGPQNDLGCTDMGGICQPSRYICQGHDIKNKCAGAKTRQCCMPGDRTHTHTDTHHSS